MKEKKQRRLPNKFMLVCRGLVGAYLLYTSYSLWTDGIFITTGTEHMAMWFFFVFFIIVGIILIVFALKNYMQGYYEGGKMDPNAGLEAEAAEETAELLDMEETADGEAAENTVKEDEN